MIRNIYKGEILIFKIQNNIIINKFILRILNLFNKEKQEKLNNTLLKTNLNIENKLNENDIIETMVDLYNWNDLSILNMNKIKNSNNLIIIDKSTNKEHILSNILNENIIINNFKIKNNFKIIFIKNRNSLCLLENDIIIYEKQFGETIIEHNLKRNCYIFNEIASKILKYDYENNYVPSLFHSLSYKDFYGILEKRNSIKF